MISILALFVFGWFFFKSVGLAFRVAWCAAKAVAAVVFLAILYLGMDAIVSALLFAVFASYAIFGIINHAINLAGK